MNIKQGETWRNGTVIKENGLAKNCTDLICKMVILKKGSTEPKVLTIVWDSQSTGIGHFLLTHDESKALSEGNYDYEVYLYKDNTYFKSIKTGVLEVAGTLKNDLI